MKHISGRTLILTFVLSLGLALSMYARRDDSEQHVDLKGLISDSMCGFKHMMAGDEAKCTRACVKNGSHYVLLVGHEIHELVSEDEDLDKLAGKRVEVIGSMASNGTIRVISVRPQPGIGPARTGNGQQKTESLRSQTIEGLVRDIACPVQNGRAAARTFDLKCALECVRLGSPIIVQTDSGSLYVPISEAMPDQGQHARITPFVGKYVEVRGKIFERHGMRAIMVESVRELKAVRLVTDAQ